MKLAITDAFLRTLAPPPKGARLEVRDTTEAGLILRMTHGGAATWSVRGRVGTDGRHSRVKLGTWPALGISAARSEARKARGILETGADPVAKKRAVREARKATKEAEKAAEGETVSARLLEWQRARLGDPAAPWSPRYAAEVVRVCDKAIVPALGAKLLRATTREDWTALIQGRKADAVARKAKPKKGEPAKRGAPAKGGAGAAAFLYRTASAFLNYAEALGWIAAPMLPRKGAATIAPPPPDRARVLTDAELAAIWRAADREPPKLRAFTRLLILTAAREREVADMVASEVDLEAARWTIPGARTKNRTGYVLPLSPLALAELRTVWPNEEPEARDFILGRTAGNGFRGFGKLKMRLDAASRVQGWRWHDLRRTARTGMTRLGVPRDHAEAAINHISGRSALERTYDRHDYAPEVIAALTLWQAHVAGLVSASAEVVALPKRKRAAG
jgi:integrase